MNECYLWPQTFINLITNIFNNHFNNIIALISEGLPWVNQGSAANQVLDFLPFLCVILPKINIIREEKEEREKSQCLILQALLLK